MTKLSQPMQHRVGEARLATTSRIRVRTFGSSLLVLIAVEAFLFSSALADTPINETRSVSSDARIEVFNVRGSIKVRGWDKSEVSISGTLGEGSAGLTVDGGGSSLRIKVEPPEKQGWFSWGSSNNMQDSILDIRMPRTGSLRVDAVSALVDASDLEGRELSVDTVSGKVRLEAKVRDLSVDSVSGNIEADGSADNAKFETVSGDVRIRASGGDFRFDTVSGDVDADLDGYEGIAGGSVSGDMHFRGAPRRSARVELESMSGDVTIEVPANGSASLRAKTFSGDLDSDFGTITEPDHGPGRSLETEVGDASGRIHLETFSGDIEIRKR